MNKTITISAEVAAPIEKVWEYWTNPKHITKWAFASDDWEAPHAENDLRTGGKFLTRMQAKDGSAGFDLTGEYNEVVQNERIAYTMDDGRTVVTIFEGTDEGTHIVSTFEMENENPEEMQREGWQSILNNFKKHVEEN
ncbi:MAG TPA: SRPBCC domain-containing protein [Candidatus Paceibacterota bacterium]